ERKDVGVGLAGVKDDRLPVAQRLDLQRLHLPAFRQVGLVLRQETVEKAVGLLCVSIDGSRGAADVLDDPEISVRVVLDPLEAAAAEDAGHVVYDGREVKRGRPDAAVVEVLRREEEPLRKRVPGRAVEDRKVVAVAILGREERYPVRLVRVEVDPRDVARRSEEHTSELL